MSEPIAAYGTHELGEQVSEGDRVRCPVCGAAHVLTTGVRWEAGRLVPGALLFYTCGAASYIAAIDGQRLPGLEGAPRVGEVAP